MIFDYKMADFLEIEPLRIKYLDSLPVFQELYMEWLVKKADCYKIYRNANTAGYFIISADKILLEFYLKQEFIKECENVFQEMLNKCFFKKAYCKSFDSVLLKCCLSLSCKHKVIGTLFRDRIDNDNANLSEFTVKIATRQDIDTLILFKDGLYESEEELCYMVANKIIHMFFDGNDLVGCGFLIKVHDNYEFRDIGMWVNTPFRNSGIAVKIISYLKKVCADNAYIPICGCDKNNIASRKTLEKNGFISKYDLIEFSMETEGHNEHI